MKKYLIAVSAFTIMAFTAGAQEKNNSTGETTQQYEVHPNKQGHGSHQHRYHNMTSKLNLTDAQKQQLKDINSDYRNHLKALEQNENITLKDYRAKKARLQQEKRSKFQDILTSDQKNTIAREKTERGEKMKMMAQKRLEKMKVNLNLTDAQVAKIQQLHNTSMEQAKAIRENTSLTQEQKKEQFINLMKSRKESMNNILTAEQLKKKEDMRNSRINDMKNKRANKES